MQDAVKRVVVTNFKSIQSADLELAPLNVLIGSNASGKSNFLSLFTLLNALSKERLESHVNENGGAGALLFRGHRQSPSLGFRFEFEAERGTNAYEASLEYTHPGNLLFQRESVSFQAKNHPRGPRTYAIGFGKKKESGLGKAIKSTDPGLAQTAAFAKIRLDRWRSYHFHDTSKYSRIKSLSEKHLYHYLDADAGNLAPFLRILRSKYSWHYEQIREAIKIAYPEFNDFILEESAEVEGKLALAWTERGSDYEIRALQGSDGSLRFMCLATLLLQPLERTEDNPNAPFALLIDEPELGLHPRAIAVLAELLQSVSRNCQIIVSTQSPNLLSAIDRPGGTITVQRQPDGASQFRRLEAKDLEIWLQDYSMGDAWQMGLFELGGFTS